jgi:hypothetical protein
MTDRQAMPVALRIVVMSRFPPGQVSKRDDCIQGGAVRAHLTFQAVGMTRATTASTSPAAASRCGSSSARSACSKKADSSLRLRELTDSIRSECRWQLDWLVRMQGTRR